MNRTPLHYFAGAYEALYLEHYGVTEIRDAAYNQMFSEECNWLTRFIRPVSNTTWTCAHCGKKRGRKWFWTQLVPFRSATMNDFFLDYSDLLPALTPVCGDHLLAPWGDA